jgi:hypothetical protein
MTSTGKGKAVLVLNYHAMKTNGWVEVHFHQSWNQHPKQAEWSASRPFYFTPGERSPGIHWIGGWVNPRAGLDDMDKIKFLTLEGLELRSLGRPARSQSLYRLRYPASPILTVNMFKRERGCESDQCFCILFGRSLVWISYQRPIMLSFLTGVCVSTGKSKD